MKRPERRPLRWRGPVPYVSNQTNPNRDSAGAGLQLLIIDTIRSRIPYVAFSHPTVRIPDHTPHATRRVWGPASRVGRVAPMPAANTAHATARSDTRSGQSRTQDSHPGSHKPCMYMPYADGDAPYGGAGVAAVPHRYVKVRPETFSRSIIRYVFDRFGWFGLWFVLGPSPTTATALFQAASRHGPACRARDARLPVGWCYV